MHRQENALRSGEIVAGRIERKNHAWDAAHDFFARDRADLGPRMAVRGPAIVEEASATTVVDVDGVLSVDRHGSLLITIGGAS